MNKSTLIYETVGIVFIVLLGSLLHFTFEVSGKNIIVAIFSAVNESTWEHLKLGFWPALLYALIEYRYRYKKKSDNFFFSRVIGIYLIPISIIVLFYSYTAFIEDNLIADILVFIIAVIIGRLVSYKLLITGKITERIERISLIALIILAIAFIVFTFYPPQMLLFRDPIFGKYGIIS